MVRESQENFRGKNADVLIGASMGRVVAANILEANMPRLEVRGDS